MTRQLVSARVSLWPFVVACGACDSACQLVVAWASPGQLLAIGGKSWQRAAVCGRLWPLVVGRGSLWQSLSACGRAACGTLLLLPRLEVAEGTLDSKLRTGGGVKQRGFALYSAVVPHPGGSGVGLSLIHI